jgi:hypothetical protein
MAQKKERAFFICPRWNELAAASRSGQSGPSTSIPFNGKILAAIAAGQPVARSTLRRALLAARSVAGTMIDIDPYIVDQRRRPTP